MGEGEGLAGEGEGEGVVNQQGVVGDGRKGAQVRAGQSYKGPVSYLFTLLPSYLPTTTVLMF